MIAEIMSKTESVYTKTEDGHLEENGKCKAPTAEKELLDYDPHDYGNTNHPIGYLGAVVHLLRSTIGTGILVLPFAFRGVGYGIGIIGTLVIGLLYVNNIHALLFTEYELCKKLNVRKLTFVGVVEKSFEVGPKLTRKFGPYFKSLLYIYYGIPSGNSIYMLIIADNMRHIYQYFFQTAFTLKESISAVILPIVLLCLIPKLKFLVPFSIVTNVFTVINIGIILLYSLNFETWKRNANLVEDVNNVPKFFAIVLQSLIATGMILPLKNDMRNPKTFGSKLGVLNVSFALLTLLFGTFGLVGYLNYGDKVHDNILSNLPPGKLVTVCVYVLYTLALCVTYTLLFYVYYDTIWSNVLEERVAKTRYEKHCRYTLRICINVCACLMALAVPNFSLFTSILGTVGIIIEIGLPSTLQLLVLCTIKVKPAVFIYSIVKNLTIILIAVIMFCMSCKACFLDMMKLYDSGST